MYPRLTDTFFHPSSLDIAFVDKSERVAMTSFSPVQLNFPKEIEFIFLSFAIIRYFPQNFNNTVHILQTAGNWSFHSTIPFHLLLLFLFQVQAFYFLVRLYRIYSNRSQVVILFLHFVCISFAVICSCLQFQHNCLLFPDRSLCVL